MKKYLILALFLFANTAFADFPINNYRVKVIKLEVWPSNEGVGRYNAWVETPIPTDITGCRNGIAFSIEKGPGADAAYSTLLAAVMTGKEIELYLTRCEYFVVADRIRIIP